jgi:hypothetical protein
MFTVEEQKEIQLFLALLFPWDDGNKDLWKSVSWTFVGKEGDLKFASYAAQSMGDLCHLIETRTNRPSANLYVALGTQRTATLETKSVDGFPKASRTHKNIVSFKSLFLDIDVGKQGAYATTGDARHALEQFCQTVGLPEPTMLLLSGSGGLHVYWCFDKPVPIENWRPLAGALQAAGLHHKLKFDPQVTIDVARILRVPNTFNHKTTPPTKVQLIREPGHSFPRYGYQQMVSALSVFLNRDPAHKYIAPLQAPKLNSNFSSGMEQNAAPPVDIDDVAANCPTLDDILARGGKGDSEPLWNLALYAASFTTDPHAAAHRLSDQDPRYTKDATEKKLVEKINARANNPNAGWPTCQSFSTLSPECATCPLFAQGKTPFHHARRPTPAATPSQFMPAGNDPLMPDDYWRNKDQHVFTTMLDKQGNPFTVEVVNYPIHDAGIDEDDEGRLLYETSISGIRRWREINVGANMQPLLAASALARNNGMFIKPINHKAARDFFVSWVQHLQDIKRYANQSAYGWSADGKSFAFDDQLFRDNGTTDMVYRGRRHNSSFMPVGDLKPWQDAMPLVYGNMPLEVTVATAFAAPLIELIGSYSLVVSLYSHLSGIGKSTAMMLAQAVWGHPRAGMSTLDDTTNAMMKKIGDLKNLPVYWDELRTKDQLEKVIDIVFQVTQGKGKARMNRDTSLAEVATFTTMFVVASNHGVGDTVYHQTESTSAGGLRLFEIEAMPLTTTMPDYAARQLIIPLQHNYGVAGATYAKWLALNRNTVLAALDKVAKDLEAKHHFEAQERFWAMTMASLIVGAGLANYVGLTRFDIAGIKAYLDVALGELRSEMKLQNYATMSATQDVVSLMNEIMLDARNKGLIITERIPYGAIGRPVPMTLVDTDMSKVNDPWLWVGQKDGRVRARVRPFNDWLRKRRLNPRQFIEALKGHYHVMQSKQTIGTGVVGLDALSKFGRYECYDFTPLNVSSPSPDSDAPN